MPSTVVRIVGETTQHPTEPGDLAMIRAGAAVVQGGIAVSVTTVILMYFYHWSFALVAPFGAVATVLLALLRWKRASTKQDVPRIRLSNLEREQWLLTQLQRYRVHGRESKARVAELDARLGEMKALLTDMQGARGDYQNRIDVVARGVASLEAQLDHEHRLADAIEQAEEMVVLEYRTSRLLESLPDDAIDRVTDTVATLDQLTAERVELELQLEANAEAQSIASA